MAKSGYTKAYTCAMIEGQKRAAAMRSTSGDTSERVGSAQIVYRYLSPYINTPSDTLEQECLMSTSKLQREFSFALSTHFGGYTIRENSRPEWCLGDNYERLELDFWIVELDVAIEIQGNQHYVYTPHFHGNYEGFKAQQARDETKKQRCFDYGITLLEVDDDESVTEAINYIASLVNGHYSHRPIDQYPLPTREMEFRQMRNKFRKITSRKGELTIRQIGQQTQLLRVRFFQKLEKYGMSVFDGVSPDVVADIFFFVQKTASYTTNGKKRYDRMVNKQQALRAAIDAADGQEDAS